MMNGKKTQLNLGLYNILDLTYSLNCTVVSEAIITIIIVIVIIIIVYTKAINVD